MFLILYIYATIIVVRNIILNKRIIERFKESQDEKINNERERIYSDIHDYLGGKLTDIYLLTDIIKKKILNDEEVDKKEWIYYFEKIGIIINEVKEKLNLFIMES